MDTSLYNNKYKLLVSNLLTHTQFADNPIKFDGRAQGQQFLHYTPEQCKNILEHLQNEDRVLKIVKYKKLNTSPDPLDDDNYYLLEVLPSFDAFAKKLLNENDVEALTPLPKLQLSQKPVYHRQRNTLSIAGLSITVNSKTIEGIILDKLLNSSNKRVEIITIEKTYREVAGLSESYTLESPELYKKVKSINQKVRRKLQTKIGLISIKDKYLTLNEKLVTNSDT
jgi:hypothetical protein